MQIGDRVGAQKTIVLDQVGNYILCFDDSKREFVTWYINFEGRPIDGRYWSKLESAFKDFVSRYEDK